MQQSISIKDRGFNYGDGFFSTILVEQGQLCHWPLHAQRLSAAAQALRFPVLDLVAIKSQLQQAISDQASQTLVAKVVVSRGVGGRGYSPGSGLSPSVVVSTADFPANYLSLRQQGLTVDSADQILASGSVFHQHKTLNRLEQVLLKAEAEEKGVDELICFDILDSVVEGVASNLFWRKGKKLYTPDLKLAGVAGVQRRVLLDAVANSPYQLSSGQFSLDDLSSAEEIFFSNAIMKFAPVKRWAKRTYHDFEASHWFNSNT